MYACRSVTGSGGSSGTPSTMSTHKFPSVAKSATFPSRASMQQTGKRRATLETVLDGEEKAGEARRRRRRGKWRSEARRWPEYIKRKHSSAGGGRRASRCGIRFPGGGKAFSDGEPSRRDGKRFSHLLLTWAPLSFDLYGEWSLEDWNS